MKDFPDFDKAFDYENRFYLSCDVNRIAKMLAHYELFKMVQSLPGAIVECGVFKGASLSQFAMFREILENDFSKRIIGFDIFGDYPETSFEADKGHRKEFIESAGQESILVDQMIQVLENKKCRRNVELIAGDICATVPNYVQANSQLKISLLNLDTDIYEPAVTILEHLWPRIVKGGILILDDYAVFPGETKAVDDYFKGVNVKIQKFGFCMTPCYIIKE